MSERGNLRTTLEEVENGTLFPKLGLPLTLICLASYADVLTGSSRKHSSPRGEEWLRDEPVRTSA